MTNCTQAVFDFPPVKRRRVQAQFSGEAFGVALVLIGMVLTMNALSIGLRMYLRGKKKW